jgi:hypothetical protein
LDILIGHEPKVAPSGIRMIEAFREAYMELLVHSRYHSRLRTSGTGTVSLGGKYRQTVPGVGDKN